MGKLPVRFILTISLLASAFAIATTSLSFSQGQDTPSAPAPTQVAPEFTPAKPNTAPQAPTLKAESRTGLSWSNSRNNITNRLAGRGGYNVMFIGDSITHSWDTSGRNVWGEKIAPFQALNAGFGGDHIQHILWCLQNGLLDGDPNLKLIVLLAGTNDAKSSQGIADGIKLLLAEIKKRKPGTKVLLLGILPRGKGAFGPFRMKNRNTNLILAMFADNKRIFFKDVGHIFLLPDRTIPPTFMADGIIPTEEGYRRLADAILPDIKKLLEAPKPVEPSSEESKAD